MGSSFPLGKAEISDGKHPPLNLFCDHGLETQTEHFSLKAENASVGGEEECGMNM